MARPIGIDGELVEHAGVIDPGLGEQAAHGRGERQTCLADLVTLRIALPDAAEAARGMDRLAAGRQGSGGGLVGGDHLVIRIALLLHEFGRLKQADIDLFLPAAHPGTREVIADRVLPILAIAIALGEVEGIAGAEERILLRFEGAREDRRIAAVGLGVAPARAIMVAPHDHAVEVAGGILALAGDELVQHAAIEPAQAVADQLHALVGNRGVADLDHVAVAEQRRQAIVVRHFERVVRVDDQRIVGQRPGQFQRFGSVEREVLPRTFIELAGKVAQVVPDDVLRPVGGAGVDDHPVRDERPDAVEAAGDHRRLVLDDHAQADSLTRFRHALAPADRVRRRVISERKLQFVVYC